MRIIVPLTMLATALACSFGTAPANARARTFVASYGSDSNPCTFLSPCRNFQQAVNVTDVGGEVTAIDSAGFGPIVINQPVTITSPPGVEAGIVQTSFNPAISIPAVSQGVVQLRGLTLDGTGGGTHGIAYSGSGLRVKIIDCLIRNFSNDGIILGPTGAIDQISTAAIANTIASNNGGFGIEISPFNIGIERGTIDHVTTNGNGASGIYINGTQTSGGGFADFAISNVVTDSNSADGILVDGNGNVKVEVRDSTLSNNREWGLLVSNARVGIYANSIVLNQEGFSIGNAGVINSFGNNNIENNAGASTGTLTQVPGQ